MELRQLGNSGLAVSPVIFGAWAAGGWFWGGQDDADSIRAIHAALDAGVNCVDTAPIYGMGHSEEVVGKAIRGRRDKVLLATKCGLRWDTPGEGSNHWTYKALDGTEKVIVRNL
ncbi:MAG: aldo/keto reductase, partial [Planctomycetes bacterium]|nr:aldo/keto reductase [Planctomycetota bacterium]